MATQDYNKLTVVQIREILKTRGIPATGLTRKQQLIDKLKEVDAATTEASDALPNDEAVQEAQPEGAPDKAKADAQTTAEVAPVNETNIGSMPQDPATSPAGKKSPVSSSIPEPALPATQSKPATGPEEVHEGKAMQESLAVEPPSSQSPMPTQETAPPTIEETQQMSAPTSPTGEDTRKRKRRSLTPPPKEEEVAKKRAKQEMDAAPSVQIKDDMAKAGVKQAAVDVSTSFETSRTGGEKFDAQSESENAKALPAVPGNTTEQVQSAQAAPKDSRFKHLGGPSAVVDAVPLSRREEDDDDRPIEPAVHPATNSIYIRNLKRPLRPDALKTHLASLAQPSSDPEGAATAGSDSPITTFHLDSIRTHAFAVFSSISAAARVRSGLHNRTWPNEREREPLWVDFVPEDKVGEWIQTENGGGRRPETKRWEVVYAHQDGNVTAELAEAGATAPRRSIQAGVNASAPSPSLRSGPQPPSPEVRHESDAAGRDPSGTLSKPEQPASFLALDALFPSTKAKPKLYYKPVEKELADKRLDELDARSSQRAKGTLPPGGSGYADSRRYTFEEGDLLVDGGPEFGLRNPTGFRGGRGGRDGGGFGGRGGYRGGR